MMKFSDEDVIIIRALITVSLIFVIVVFAL